MTSNHLMPVARKALMTVGRFIVHADPKVDETYFTVINVVDLLEGQIPALDQCIYSYK